MKLLPVEIFLIIREYIENRNDYRMFMDCNKEIFQSIKYQTVYFMIRINFNSLQYDESVLGLFKNFKTLTERVKDKSKQIGLYLHNATSKLLMFHASLFRQIHHLKILFSGKLTHQLFFNIFNNIYHVELNCLRGITTIDSGFENVHVLTINDSLTLKEMDLRHATALDQLSLIACPNITILNGFNSVHCVTLHHIPPNLDGFQLIPNVPYTLLSLSRSFPSLFSPDLYMDMLRLCDLSHLNSLSIFNLGDLERHDLSIFRNIPSLTLASSLTAPPDYYPSLPIFNGRSLDLTGFNLLSWTSANFIPNVKRIRLSACTHLDPRLSFLTNVRTISLQTNDQIITVDSLPYRVKLELTSLKSLKFIVTQPRLLNLKISHCPQLSDYESDGQLFRRVEINTCPELLFLNKFRNTQEFIYRRHTRNTNHSFLGYDVSDLLLADRIVRLTVSPVLFSSLPTSVNCLGLANLHLLDVIISGEILDLSNFHDIHTVRIQITSTLVKEISYLRNIQVLKFTEMNSLQSLHHLENIDKIMLCPFPADFQFDGLKGCRVVCSRGNKRLEEQAELYGRGERDVSLFDSSYLEMFGSIEEFHVVLEDDVTNIRLW